MSKVWASELEHVSKKFDHEARFERNKIVHGANVTYHLWSLRTLKEEGPRSRYENALAGFIVFYGRSAAELGPKVDGTTKAPEKVIKVLNSRGNFACLDAWEAHPERQNLIKKCDGIIDMWLEGSEEDKVLAECDKFQAYSAQFK